MSEDSGREQSYPVYAVVDGEKRLVDLMGATALIVEVAPGVEVGLVLSVPQAFSGTLTMEIPCFDLRKPLNDQGYSFEVRFGGANTVHVTPVPPSKVSPMTSSAAGDGKVDEKTKEDSESDPDDEK